MKLYQHYLVHATTFTALACYVPEIDDSKLGAIVAAVFAATAIMSLCMASIYRRYKMTLWLR